MRAYENDTKVLSFSYHTPGGRGVFRVRVDAFLFPAMCADICSRRQVCTLRDFRRLLDVLELSDDGPEVAAFPLYYHLSRGIERLRAKRDKIEPKGTKADKDIQALAKSISAACRLSAELVRYGYPELQDGRPESNVRDWIRATHPTYTRVIWETNRSTTWSALQHILEESPRGADFAIVCRYTGLIGDTIAERDVVFSIIEELERRGLRTAAA